MSEASDYKEAQRRIAAAKAEGRRELDLAGLEDLTRLPPEIAELDLTQLNLDNTKVDDLILISQMTAMTRLDADNTKVSDLTPIAGMTEMTELYLSNTQVSDITPIAGMKEMTKLYLHNTQVSDLTLIAGMTEMTTLSLNNTRVSDLTPIAGMREMTGLYLNNTQVSDFTPIAGMTEMTTLYLHNTQVSDLTLIAGMTEMTELYLHDTQVSDLAPIAGMTEMTTLSLNNTRVSDLTPIAGMTEMTTLYLHDTQVSDPRSLLNFPKLESPDDFFDQVQFEDIPALTLDPTLAEIAEIEDRLERATRLFAHLREIGDDWPPIPPDSPAQTGAPRIDLVEDRVELVRTHPDAEEAADPVKQKTLERLRDAVERLLRVGNRYPDIDSVARSLSQHIAPDLTEIDLLEVHLDLEITRGIYDRREEREGEDRFDPEAVSALERVGLVGPGLTLDNPEVERLEERRLRYREDPQDKPTQKAQDDLSRSISEEGRVFGDDLRKLEDRLSKTDDKSERLLTAQNDAGRNTVLRTALWVGNGVFWAAISPSIGSSATVAMEWLVANSETILTLAPHWGEAFKAWITPILMRSREALAAMRGKH